MRFFRTRAWPTLPGVLVALLVAPLAAFASLTGCGGGTDSPPPVEKSREEAEQLQQWKRALGDFLSRGPTGGSWAITTPHAEHCLAFAPHPKDPESTLVADIQKGEDGQAEITQLVGVARGSVPLHFFKAPPWLFFLNYELRGEPEPDPVPGYPEAVRLTWGPKHDEATLTSRHVWVDAKRVQVVQVEDRSRTGHPIQTVTRRRALTVTISPSEDELATCCRPQPPKVTADDPERARAAPFPVYEPVTLPEAFVRIRADYRSDRLDPDDPLSGYVRRATLLYSDGLALLSVMVGPRADLNAIQGHYAKMKPRDDDPNACPGLPASPKELRESKAIVRMRADGCRTVLRRDDVEEELSVMVMGRNELPTEAYLEAILDLQPIK